MLPRLQVCSSHPFSRARLREQAPRWGATAPRVSGGWSLTALAIAAALFTGGATAWASMAEDELYDLKTDLFFVHLPPGSTRTAGGNDL
ncbi:hypothetical protein SA2016_2123 [Sinomonas atrocyanea]|uniref:Uncharacterized protein n=1 Tax=Sinomonas atrocyanea TaxID=37927 RepID=A0A127A587_9MICC|nr:hypothetical protein SA2016_2123 [Sinomonas atrocyanea]GEB65495.1 hypothetical protein SAT01_29430 [Sinomonas atrocyanea]